MFPFGLQTHALSAVAGTAADSATHIQAHVRWLVCREVCVPGKAFLGLNLPRSATPDTRVAETLIASAIKAEPTALPREDSVQVSASRDQLALAIKTGHREDSAEFYPLDEDALRNAADQVVVPSSKGALLKLERGDVSGYTPKHLKGVLKLSGNRAYLIEAPVQPMPVSAAAGSTLGGGFAVAILLALAGGLVLNLMPCVFPVLFLKAISLATAQARIAARRGYMASSTRLASWLHSGPS